MSARSSTVSVARFSSFELNLATGELRKNGVRIRLQQQPFVVLSALLEQPGQLVTREDLQQRLWPDGRFVDYEDGLATAVKKVRRALQDSSATPRFIETLPKRGYRFIGEVEIETVEPREPRVASSAATPRRFREFLRWAAAAAAVAALVAWRTFDSPEAEANLPLLRALTVDSGVTADPAVSADGKWLVYCSDRDGGDDLDIWVQPLPPLRGEPVQVTDDPGHEIRPAISPDGKEVAWEAWTAAKRGVYVAPHAGGEKRFIAPGGNPRYSPDGRWLAVQGSGSGFVLAPCRGGPMKRLENFPNAMGRFAWLPDSSGLVTISKPDDWGRTDLQVTPVDGGEAWDLPLDPVREAAGKQRLDLADLRLAAGGGDDFLARTFRGAEVWRLGLAPGRRRIEQAKRLVELPVANVVHVDWIDEKLFMGVREPNLDIVALRLDVETGTNRQEIELLTDDPVHSRSTSVSADGSRIAYTSESADGSIRPWFRDLNTGENYAIDDRLTPAGGVRISPDGSRIAFAAVPGGPRERFAGEGGSVRAYSLYVHDLRGSETREVCRNCGEAEAWRSDGKAILTTIDPPGGGNTSIWLVEIESGKGTLFAEGLWGPMPSFIHGDRWIVFANRDRILAAPYRDGRMAPEAEWTELAPPGYLKRFPVVSPQGRMLYYTSNADSHWCIWAQPIDPSTVQPQGEPFAVYHSHRFRDGLAPSWGTGLAIRSDGLLFNWQKDNGNIWMLDGVKLD